MKYLMVNLSLVAMLVLVGCQATPQRASRAWPAGLPTDAVLVGGGLAGGDLRFPVDGYVIVVDPQTNTAITTVTAAANKDVELDPQMVVGSLLIARYGARGPGMLESMSDSADQESLPTDPLTMEIYFVPVSSNLSKLE